MNEQTYTNIPEFTDADKREAVFHNFDDKPQISGLLMAIETGAFGNQYVIKTELGIITVGTYDVLKGKIQSSDIESFVKIVCKGNKLSPKTKRTYKDFDVWVKKS